MKWVGLYSSDDAVTRKSLVQRIRQQPRLTSDEDLAEFARDFIAGKPLDRAYMPAILCVGWLDNARHFTNQEMFLPKPPICAATER